MSDYISKDLIDDIFTRLPTKSLLRFRSVSKSVCARISSPNFIRKNAMQSQPKFLIRHRLLHGDRDYYTIHSEDQLPSRNSGGYNDEETFNFPYRYTYNIVGSCNGIFCVYEKDLFGSYFSLWNPSIRCQLKLPDVPFCDRSSLDDPFCNRRSTVGFGFDSVNDDYKIVWLSYSQFRHPRVCSFVYTMKTNAWCKIQVPSTTYSEVSSYACLFNGALYWIANCDSNRVDDIDRRFILTFDLSTHLFGKIVLPKPNWGIHRLAIIKGSLAVFSTTYNNSGIWVREEHDNTSSWSLFFESTTTQFESDKIFELTTGDFLFHSYYTTPEVYNLETGVSKRLTERVEFSPKVNIEKFVETLELLGKGTSYEGKQPSFARSQKKKKITYTWVTLRKLSADGHSLMAYLQLVISSIFSMFYLYNVSSF